MGCIDNGLIFYFNGVITRPISNRFVLLPQVNTGIVVGCRYQSSKHLPVIPYEARGTPL